MINFIKKDEVLYDTFMVIDEDNNPVTGLVDGDFTKVLYNPSNVEVSGSITITIIELGNGIYKFSFTPNKLGNWTIKFVNATYFPWGKGMSYTCILETDVGVVEVLVRRILGLSQENYRIFSPTYISKAGTPCMTSAIIKIYDSASDCESNTNPIAEYTVTATFDSQARMQTYKVKRV